MAMAIGRKTGTDRISIEVERIISRGRFNKGSLPMGAGIECSLTADNYSIHKHEKIKNRF